MKDYIYYTVHGCSWLSHEHPEKVSLRTYELNYYKTLRIGFRLIKKLK